MSGHTAVGSLLLESPGWEDCIEARLLRRAERWRDAPEFRSHGHTLRRLFADGKDDGPGTEAVLCVKGRPTVCVKDGRSLDDGAVEECRRRLWSLDATTLLVVERRNKIQVFSTFCQPSPEDRDGSRALLAPETIEQLQTAELALRLRQLVRRIETGAIYREHKPFFNPKETVDRLLLENLKATRDSLCPTPSGDGYRRAHALLGKFLFSCYLLDRGIIGRLYLKKNRLPEADDMLGLLAAAGNDAAATLDRLFEGLHRDFNGSLFGSGSEITLQNHEVDYLRRFLAGEDPRGGQKVLFKLYDFRYIPVELISAIYQEFLGAEAEAEARPVGRNRPRDQGRRKAGAYYTPPRLAELAVDIATEDWDTLLDKRCLDAACGSGIFLVILFVRMAEEWRKRHPRADTKSRYEALMGFLATNLRGVDVEKTACLVTCFSLYLALLDQMEPKEIIELREALERDSREKLLPRILWEMEKNRPRPPHLESVRELDFFDLECREEFHLVIGNPPWVSRKGAPSVEAWLYAKNKNPAADGLKESEKKSTLFPNGEQACAFMWKAGRHVVRDGGRVCQILPSRVFLSNNTDRFQAAWLRRHRLEAMWLLADYRFVLFPGANCPCFIGRYRPRQDNEPLGAFDFLSPKVELLDPREATIPVEPEDQKQLDEAAIIAAAEAGEAVVAWKRHHWGTLRDQRLIERLRRLPKKLGDLCARPPRMTRDTADSRNAANKRRWWKGQGFQPLTETDMRDEGEGESGAAAPWPIWWHGQQRFLRAAAASDNLFLDVEDCPPYGPRRKEVRRSIAPELSRAPLLLINKACTKFLFSDFNVIFQDDFQSICGPESDEAELLFLTAVLASPLAQYLRFHTTANIGVERDIARLEELLDLPFPLPEEMPDRRHSQAIVANCAEVLRSLKAELFKPENRLKREQLVEQAKPKLNDLVYQYFDICTWERCLIEDAVEIFRPSSTPGSLDSETLLTAQRSTFEHRKAYAETLVSTFAGWTRTKSALWASGFVAPEPELAMVSFHVGGRRRDYAESDADEKVEELLKKIRQSSSRPAGAVNYLRGFVYYEGTTVHLLKPLARRHWTRTAALNDADDILSRMMEEGGWDV